MSMYFFFFFFNDTATTEIYPLSLHDALPISEPRHLEPLREAGVPALVVDACGELGDVDGGRVGDRKSTRLNSSHSQISYAVFCLKKKKNTVPHETYIKSDTDIVRCVHHSRAT